MAPRLDVVARELERCGDAVPSTDDPAWAALESTLHAARDELRAISHGLHPSLLEAEGLGAALRSLLRRRGSAATVLLADGARARRFGPVAESAAYAAVAKALDAERPPTRIELRVEGGDLVAVLTGDGGGPTVGADLRDVVEGRGGQVVADDAALTLRVPVGPAPD